MNGKGEFRLVCPQTMNAYLKPENYTFFTRTKPQTEFFAIRYTGAS
jgi:hypothetical protein